MKRFPVVRNAEVYINGERLIIDTPILQIVVEKRKRRSKRRTRGKCRR